MSSGSVSFGLVRDEMQRSARHSIASTRHSLFHGFTTESKERMNFGSTVLEIQGSSAIVRPEAGEESRAEGVDADGRDVVLRGGDETDDFSGALRAATEHDGVALVVVDLARVRQITSRALGAIVDSTNRLAPRHGKVAVAGASARIQKVMDTLKLSTLIASFESTQAAIDAKGSRPGS